MKLRPYKLSQLDFDDFTLAGYSVAGEEAVVLAPEFDVAFDIGKCPREALTVNNVLLSHGHTDHSAGLIYYFAQRDFQGIEGGRAFVPDKLVGPVKDLLRAWSRVDGQLPPHEVIGVKPGDDIELRRDLLARVFPTVHRHPRGSVGYSLVEVRRKLKEQYLGLSGPEIVKLKEQGVEIARRTEVSHVAYLGDTARANYSDLVCVRDARVLLIECTFFEDDHSSRARAGKHIHVDDLPEILEGMNNERIVLTHVTRRTHLAYARRVLKKRLPAEIHGKVCFLMTRLSPDD
jgi:ribonuclease Z